MREQLNFESKEKTKECDFYYSKKHEAYLKEMSEMGFSDFDLWENTFEGKIYTEAVEKGNKPTSKFDDFVLVGTGSFDSTKSKPIKIVTNIELD